MRRHGRQCALQIIYQMDMQKLLDGQPVDLTVVDNALADFWHSFEPAEPDDRDFAERLVRGVLAELGPLDEAIAAASRTS